MGPKQNSLVIELDRLVRSDEGWSLKDVQVVLDQLLEKETAFETTHFLLLLDLVMNSRLNRVQKSSIVRNILVPENTIPLSVLYKILGCIGKNMGHSKVPAWGIQSDLLRWLVCWNHAFQTPDQSRGSVLRNVAPILYQLLPFEFLRVFIVNLIILLGATPRKWQIELVCDLFSRFPTDEHLKCLLVLFKLRDPWIDFESICGFKVNLGTILETLKYPDLNLARNMTLRVAQLKENLKFYDSFNAQVPKKSKTVSHISELLAPPLHSFQDIVHQINSSFFMDFQTFSASKYTLLFGLLNREHAKRLDTYVRLSILDLDNSTIDGFFEQLEIILSYGVELKLVQDFLLFKYKPHALSDEEVLKYRASLFRYVSQENLPIVLENLELQLRDGSGLIDQILHEISVSLPFWIPSEEVSKKLFVLLEKPNSELFKNHTLTVNSVSAGLKKAFFLKMCRESHVTTIPSSPFVYSMVLNPNPVVQSEIYGYIAHCKKNNSHTSPILNGYITDIVNWIWREKGIELENSSRGMDLSSRFVQEIANKMPTFDFSQLVSAQNMGDLFHNPAWVYLANSALRNLEDEQEVGERHEGPVTQESIDNMQTKDWIGKGFDEIKLEVLKFLDSKGYQGLADLLFMTVRSIQGKR